MKKTTTKTKAKKATSKSTPKTTATTASNATVFYKEHARLVAGQNYTIIAACDADQMGKIHKTGDAVLDLTSYGSFFQGEELPLAELEKRLAEAFKEKTPSFNLVGKNTLEAASKFVKTTSAKKIGNTMHLQVYRI